MNLNEFIDEIILEVSYRTTDGKVDFDRTEDVDILSTILSEMGYSLVGRELRKNLLTEKGEVSTSAAKQAKDRGLQHIAFGFYSKTGQKPATHKADGENLISVSAGEFEKVAAEKSGEKPDAKEKDDDKAGVKGGEDGGEESIPSAFNPNTKGGEDYLKNLPDDDPAKPKDMKDDSEETLSTGGVIYSVGGGYYADTPDGKPKYRKVTEEGIDVNHFLYILESGVVGKVVDKKEADNGEVVTVQVIGDKESKTAEQSVEYEKLNPAEKAKVVDAKIKKNNEDFKKSKDKELFTLSLIKKRNIDINYNIMLPPGNIGSSFAETNGAYYIDLVFNGGVSKADEERWLQEMLSTPLAQSMNAKDAKRWANIALQTAKTEANTLLNNKKYNAMIPQPDGFPIGSTMDKQNRASVERLLQYKLQKAISNGNTKEIKHYETQTKIFNKLSETDTGILYVTNDGTIGFKHTSNKSSYDDTHNNTSPIQVMKGIEKLLGDNLNPNLKEIFNQNLNKLTNASSGVKGDTENFNASRETKPESEIRQENELLAVVLKNFPKFGGGTKDYLYGDGGVVKKLWFKKYANENGLKSPYDENDVMTAVFKNASSDNSDRSAQKIIEKISELVERVTPRNMEDVGKKFGLDVESMQSIINNVGKYFRGTAKSKRDVMVEVHRNLVDGIQNADSDDVTAYPTNPSGDNGRHQQAYVSGYLSRMHFDSYIMGDRDGIASQNIGGDNVESEYYRECLSDLSGFKGDTTTEEGRASLVDYLKRRVRISPEDDSISFETTDGKVVKLGVDKYRTKGDSKGVLGSLGKDLKTCLKSKAKK